MIGENSNDLIIRVMYVCLRYKFYSYDRDYGVSYCLLLKVVLFFQKTDDQKLEKTQKLKLFFAHFLS